MITILFAKWQEIMGSATFEDYESFIEEYPESKFVDSAKIMIDKLKQLTDI